MYTYDQVLWVTSKGEYRVKDAPAFLLYGRSLGSLGKVASRYRTMRDQRIEAKFWAKLPGLPEDVKDAILRIAAHQDGYARRVLEEVDEKAERIAQIGRWDD